MAIIIVDNFQVDINNPIDNRFVVGSQSIPSGNPSLYPTPFYAYKEDIIYKYPGLRIWDFNDNVPYVWDGTQWINENTTGALVQDAATGNTGFQNYVTKFANNQTLLTASSIYDSGTHVGVGLNDTANPNDTIYNNSSNPHGLHVNGNVKTEGYFVGNVHADWIVSGILKLPRIQPAQGLVSEYNINNTYLLKDYLGVRSWDLAENIINTTSIIDDTISTTNHYITFAETIGHRQMKINTSKLQFIPNSGQLFLGNGNKSNPVYSFINSTETGIYYDDNINFSIFGENRVAIRPGGITIYDPNYTQIDFYKNPTDVQKLFVGQGGTLKYRTNAWDPVDSVQVASDNIVWHSGNLSTLKNSGNLPIETGNNTNSQSFDANGNVIKGVYTYNYYGAPPVTTSVTPISNVFTNTIPGNIGTSQHVYFSVLSFGKGTEGSVQLASNWVGNNTPLDGNVVADREILIRSLRDTGVNWSPWVKIWNSGNSGYVPFGAIMMWSGSATLLPTGWRLCDGSPAVTIPAGSVPGQPSMTSIIIPDLRERFVVGAGGDNPSISPRPLYDSFYYYHWPTNVTLTGTFAIGTGGSNPNTFNIDITRLFYINSTGVGVQMVITNSLQIGSLNIRPMIHTCTPLVAFVAFDMRINQYRMFKGTATNGTSYNSNYFTFNTTLTSGLGTWVEYNKYFQNGIRFGLPEVTGAEGGGINSTILWANTENSYIVGATGGSDMVRISQSQMPSHSHYGHVIEASGDWKGDGTDSSPNSTSNPGFVNSTGGNLPHENRPPYYALAFIIYTGI